jgi:hypothetical protein
MTDTKILLPDPSSEQTRNLPEVRETDVEALREWLADIRRRRDDPEYQAYVRRVGEGAAEYRRQVEEQERIWLDEAEGK